MLYVIGLGLSDENDITVKGLEVGFPLLSASRSNILTDGVEDRRLNDASESTSNPIPRSSWSRKNDLFVIHLSAENREPD